MNRIWEPRHSPNAFTPPLQDRLPPPDEVRSRRAEKVSGELANPAARGRSVWGVASLVMQPPSETGHGRCG